VALTAFYLSQASLPKGERYFGLNEADRMVRMLRRRLKWRGTNIGLALRILKEIA
jgi:hypothetical protein